MKPEIYRKLLPEERLLMALCRLDFDKKQVSEIKDLLKEIKDWDYFVHLANGHGIIALAWHNISKSGCDQDVPEQYSLILKQSHLKSLARNTFLKNLLFEISELASKEDIKIVALKGNALEEMVYGNSGVRQMSDVDILVEFEKAIPLRNLLIQNGFRSLPVISPLHKPILPYLKSHLPPMEKNGAVVEIHVKLFDQEENSLTQNLFDTSFNPPGNPWNIFWPKPQLLFLYLLKHITNHENTKDLKVKSYLDLFVLLNKFSEEILNANLAEIARAANIEEALSEKLLILNLFWDLPLPENINTGIQEARQKELSDKFIWLIKNPMQDNSAIKIQGLFKQFLHIPGVTNKVLFIIGYLFPSFTYMKYFYRTKTKAGAMLFYPLRWWRILSLAWSEKGLRK